MQDQLIEQRRRPDGPEPQSDADQHDQNEVEQRKSPPAAVVHKTILSEGEDELRRPATALAWSGLAAGLSMGFSLVAQGLVQTMLPDASWRPLLSRLGYSIGFVIVVIGRQQLFTENTLTPILPLLDRWSSRTLLGVARLWAIVLVANLVGALLFAWAIAHTQVFTPDVRQAFTVISREALGGDIWTTLLRGIFAGWLIALMVWLLPFAEAARVLIIVIITYVVGLGGFAHIVAGSVEGFYVAATGAVSWQHVLFGFMLPTLLGNVAGGVAL